MRPTSDADSDARDTHRDNARESADDHPAADHNVIVDERGDTVHPEAHDPNPSPWAEAPTHLRDDEPSGAAVPGQRGPDHDGQLYVGAAHPDTDVTPEDAARHEPVPVDESGEPIDRADDRPAARDEAAEAHDEAARAHDEAARAHEEAERAHDEEPAAHEPAREPAREEPAGAEPPVLQPIPIGAGPVDTAHGESAPVVAVPTDRDESAEPTARPAPDGAAAELKPGDVPVAPVTAFLDETVAQDLRHRWREAQLGFVDDPETAAGDVRNLVNEAIDAITAALSSQRDALGGAAGGDTEHYRVTVQRCRALFDRLLNL